jgi:hypothetical protein
MHPASHTRYPDVWQAVTTRFANRVGTSFANRVGGFPENFCRGRRNYDAQNIALLRVAVALPALLKFSYVGKAGRIRRNP